MRNSNDNELLLEVAKNSFSSISNPIEMRLLWKDFLG